MHHEGIIGGCRCWLPQRRTYDPGSCQHCGRHIDARYLDSDENFERFAQFLRAVPGLPEAAIAHAHRRLVAGRAEFGLTYLTRDDCREGQEEAADGHNYAFFEWLRDRRHGVEEIHPSLLMAARCFAEAYQHLEDAKSR